MSETRSTRARGKAKARATASSAEPPGQQALTEVTSPVVAAQAKVKSGGKKQTKKAATPAVAPVVALPPAPASPSPQKKKRRKRIHKRKNSGVDLDAEDGEDDVPSEEVEQKAAPTSTAKTKQDTGGKTPSAKRKKKQADKEPESSLPPARKEAPVPAATRTRKRKNRSGSIGGHDEETETAAQMDARQVSVVPTKQTKQAAGEQAATKGRTTRAARAAAAAAAAEPVDAKPVSISPSQEALPATASKSKKKRKTKPTRSVSTDASSEPTPEPESRTPHSHTVPVRKSPRLAHEEITEEEPPQLVAVKPVRKIVSLAGVKGKTHRQDAAAAESTQPGSQSKVADEKPTTTPSVSAPCDEGEEMPGEERALEVTDVAVEVAAPTSTLEDDEQATIADVVRTTTEVKCEEELLRADETHDGHGHLGAKMAVRGEQDDAVPLAAFAGGLSYHSRPASSVESVLGVDSYQGDVLDSENGEQEFGSSAASEHEAAESQMGDAVAVQLVDTDRENELDVEGAPDTEPASQGSIDGSEAFTLDQEDQDDEAEYESLGVSSQSAIRERETAVYLDDVGDLDEVERETKGQRHDENLGSYSEDVPADGGRNDNRVARGIESELGDEGDLGELEDDDRVSIPSTLLLSSLYEPDNANAQENEGSSDEEEEQSGSFAEESPADGGLNNSFMDEEEQEGDWTESDDEEEFASQADTAIIDELPGLRASSSNHAPAVDEVIILSDTESDKDGDSTSPAGAVNHDDDDDDAMDLHHEEDDEEAVDHSAAHSYQADADFALTTAVGESDRSTASSATTNLNDGGETVQASHEDGGVERSYTESQMDQGEEEEPEDLADADLAETTFTDGAVADDVQDMAEGNQKRELADEDLSSSGRYESSGNESDGTIELYGDEDDESHHDDASTQGDGNAEGSRIEPTDEGVEEDILHDGVQVQRTLIIPPEPTQSAAPDSSAFTEEAAETPPKHSMVETEMVRTGSTADVITYRTTPSKHLIDTVLSASREQAWTRITEAASTTPSQSSKRSTTEHSWGLSFGVSALPDALSTAADDAGPAIGSPLSSWFFSRGPANFKKRVLIPSPSSPRQRLGSPRPLKMMRVEAATAGHAGSASDLLLEQSGNTTDRFIQSLVDKSAWRSWYSKTKPEELLDAPLPVAMVKRLGGDAALALLTHPSVKPSSPSAEQVQGAVAVPKKRRRALAQLEASILEEKKRTKAFDEELLQILQGKTLSGRDLAEEFAPLLPPTSR